MELDPAGLPELSKLLNTTLNLRKTKFLGSKCLRKIQKKPTVIETDFGDAIGIRSKMFLSLSYDHRVIDGSLGGQFLKRIADYLESFDTNREL